MNNDNKYICHFCGKNEDQVKVMVASNHQQSGICDQCIEDAAGVLFKYARRTVHFIRDKRDDE